LLAAGGKSLLVANMDMKVIILDKAAGLFMEKEFDGISMREIGEARGISIAGLHYHYKDNRGLLLAIFEDSPGPLKKIIKYCRERNSSACEQVEVLMQEIGTQPAKKQAFIRLSRQEMIKLSAEDRLQFASFYHGKFTSQIEAILADGCDKGELRPMNTILAP
jgi:AcrR family transcriptional regulator